MAGRGRTATLPAWMTGGGDGTVVNTESTAGFSSESNPAVQGASFQFNDFDNLAQGNDTTSDSINRNLAMLSNLSQPTPASQPTVAATTTMPMQAMPGMPSFPRPPAMMTPAPQYGGLPSQVPMMTPPGMGPYGGLPGPMPGMMPGMPGMMPGMGMPFPRMPPMMPPFMAGPGGVARPMVTPTAAAINKPLASTTAAASSGSTIMDPNNDKSAWTVHNTDDGRRFWFNRLSGVSTFDKPFCLKTPEERSIPPCPWKEYSSPDGRKYYSNGTDSVWDMPDEFRIWKEKVEAAEKKGQTQTSATAGKGTGPAASSSASTSGSAASASSTSASAAASSSASKAEGQVARPSPGPDDGQGDPSKPSTTTTAATPAAQSKVSSASSAPAAAPAIVYASREEAVAAFKALLEDRNVSAIAKMKEVQDACQDDERWLALKTQGEKKQALAEYQVHKLANI